MTTKLETRTWKNTAAAAVAGLLLLAPAAVAGPQQDDQQGTHEGQQQPGQHGQHGSTSGSSTSGLSASDERFIREAAIGSMMEIELGRVAQQKAASAEVKQFGQCMVQDHSKASERLKGVAADLGKQLPTALPQKQRKEMDQLTRLSGAEFDRMYMSHMVKDHKKDVAEFERESVSGDNVTVRTFARETLPTLREHLQLAQQLDSKHNGSTGRSGSGS